MSHIRDSKLEQKRASSQSSAPLATTLSAQELLQKLKQLDKELSGYAEKSKKQEQNIYLAVIRLAKHLDKEPQHKKNAKMLYKFALSLSARFGEDVQSELIRIQKRTKFEPFSKEKFSKVVSAASESFKDYFDITGELRTTLRSLVSERNNPLLLGLGGSDVETRNLALELLFDKVFPLLRIAVLPAKINKAIEAIVSEPITTCSKNFPNEKVLSDTISLCLFKTDFQYLSDTVEETRKKYMENAGQMALHMVAESKGEQVKLHEIADEVYQERHRFQVEWQGRALRLMQVEGLPAELLHEKMAAITQFELSLDKRKFTLYVNFLMAIGGHAQDQLGINLLNQLKQLHKKITLAKGQDENYQERVKAIAELAGPVKKGEAKKDNRVRLQILHEKALYLHREMQALIKQKNALLKPLQDKQQHPKLSQQERDRYGLLLAEHFYLSLDQQHAGVENSTHYLQQENDQCLLPLLGHLNATMPDAIPPLNLPQNNHIKRHCQVILARRKLLTTIHIELPLAAEGERKGLLNKINLLKKDFIEKTFELVTVVADSISTDTEVMHSVEAMTAIVDPITKVMNDFWTAQAGQGAFKPECQAIVEVFKAKQVVHDALKELQLLDPTAQSRILPTTLQPQDTKIEVAAPRRNSILSLIRRPSQPAIAPILPVTPKRRSSEPAVTAQPQRRGSIFGKPTSQPASLLTLEQARSKLQAAEDAYSACIANAGAAFASRQKNVTPVAIVESKSTPAVETRIITDVKEETPITKKSRPVPRVKAAPSPVLQALIAKLNHQNSTDTSIASESQQPTTDPELVSTNIAPVEAPAVRPDLSALPEILQLTVETTVVAVVEPTSVVEDACATPINTVERSEVKQSPLNASFTSASIAAEFLDATTLYTPSQKPDPQLLMTAIERAGNRSLSEQERQQARGEVYSLLLQGADPNYQRESDGWTPLHSAVNDHDKEMVQLLLKVASPYTRNSKNQTPLGLAQSNRYAEIIPCFSLRPSEIKPLQFVTPKKKPIAATTAQQMFADQLELIFHPTAGEAQTNIAQLAAAYPKQFQDINDCFPIKFPAVNSILSHQNFLNMKVKELNKALAALTNAFNINIEHVEVDQLKTYLPNILTAISLLKQALAAINAFNGYCKTANLEFINNDALHFSESLQKLEKLHGQIVHRIGLPEIRKEFEEWQASISSQLSSSSSHVDLPTTPSPTESKKSTVRSPSNQLARQCAEQLLEFVASRMEKFPLNQNNIPEHAESISRNTKLLAILDRLMRFFEQQEQPATDDIADAMLQLLDGLIVSMVMASGQSELPAEINQQLRAMSSELLQHAEQVGSFLKDSAAKDLHAEITALLKTNLAGFLKPEAKGQVRLESTSSPSRSVSPEQTNNTLENLQRLITSQNIKTALSPVAEGPDDFNSPEVPNTIKLRMLSAHRSEKKSATPQPAASRVSTEVVAPRAVKIFASPVTNGQEAKGTEQPIPSLLTAPVDLKVIFKESVDAVLKDFETVRQQKLQENRAFYSKFFEENAGIFKIISNLRLIIQDKDFDLQKAGYAMLQAAACMAGIFASFQQVSVSAKSQWLAHYKSFGCLHQLLKTLEALQGQSAFSNDYLFRFYSVVYASVKSTCDFYASLDHAQYVWGIKVWSEFETLAEQLKSYAADHQHHPEPMRLALSQAYGELVQLQQDHAAELNDYEIDPYVFVTALIKVVSGVVVRLEKYAQSEVSEEAVVRSAAGQLHRYLQDLHARLVINTMLDDALLGNLKELQNRVDTLRARKVSSPQPVETGSRGLSAGSNVSLADDSIVENILNSEPNVVAESTVLLPVPVAFSVASVVERALQSPADQVASPQNGSNTNPASEVVSSLLATPSPAPEKDSGFVQESPIFSPIVERPNDSLSLIARILAMPSPQPTDKNEDTVPAQVQPLTPVIITTPPRVERKESNVPSPSNALAMDCAQQLLEYVAARMEKFPLNQADIVESAVTVSRNAKLLTILDRLLRFFEGGERPATNNIADAMLQLLDGLIVSMVIASGQSNLSKDINGQLQAMSGDLLQYAQQIGVLLNDSEAQALHAEIIALLKVNLTGFLKTEAKPQSVSLEQANNALENLQRLVTSPNIKAALSPIAEGPDDFNSPEVPNAIKLRMLSAHRSEKKSATPQPATSQVSTEVVVPRVVKILASPVTNSQEAKGTEQQIPSLLPAPVDLKVIFKESVDAVLKDFETVRQQKLQENRAFYSRFFEENAGISKIISNLKLIIQDKDFDLQKAGYAMLQAAACMAGIFASFQQVPISAKSQWMVHYQSFGCLHQLFKTLEALQGQNAFSNDYLFRFYSIVYASVKSTRDFYASLDHTQHVWGIKAWSEFKTLAEQLKPYAADHQHHPEPMRLALSQAHGELVQLQQDHAAELNDYDVDPYVFVTALIKIVSGAVAGIEKCAQSGADKETIVKNAADQLHRYLQNLHARMVINKMLDDALLEDLKALQNRVNTLRTSKVSSPQTVETGSRDQVAGGREEETTAHLSNSLDPLSPTPQDSLSSTLRDTHSPNPRSLSAESSSLLDVATTVAENTSRLGRDVRPNEFELFGSGVATTVTEALPEKKLTPKVDYAQDLRFWFDVERERTPTASPEISALNTPNSPHTQLVSPASRLALEEMNTHIAVTPANIQASSITTVDNSSPVRTFPSLDDITDSPLAKGNSPVLRDSSPKQVIAEQKITESVVSSPITMVEQVGTLEEETPADEKLNINLPDPVHITSARAFLNYAQSILELVANDSRFDDFVSGLESPIKELQTAVNNQQEDVLEKVLNLVVSVIDSSMDFVNHWPSADNYRQMQQAVEFLLAQLRLFESLIDPSLKKRYQDLEYACTQFITDLQKAIENNSLEPQESKHSPQAMSPNLEQHLPLAENDNNDLSSVLMPLESAFDNDSKTMSQAGDLLASTFTPGIATEAFDAGIAVSLAELAKPHVPAVNVAPVREDLIEQQRPRAKKKLLFDNPPSTPEPSIELLSAPVPSPDNPSSTPGPITELLTESMSFSDNLPSASEPVIDLLMPEPIVFLEDKKHSAAGDNLVTSGPQSPPNISRAVSPTGRLEGDIMAGFYAEDAKGAVPLKEDHKDDSFRNRILSVVSLSPQPPRVVEQYLIEAKEKKAPATRSIFAMAAAGDLDAIKSFLENAPEDFDINARDKQGYTALMYAAANGHDLVVGEILKAVFPGTEAANQMHVTNSRTALMLAVERFTNSNVQGRNYGAVISRLLLVPGIKVKQPYSNGSSLLMRAIKLGQVELVVKLLRHESMPNSASALQQAVRCQDIAVARAMVRALLSARRVVPADYQDALLLAVQRGSHALITAFGLNNAPANVLQAALSQAILCQDIELIKLFRRHHAEVDPAVFIAAAARGQWDICRALLCDDNFNLFQPAINVQTLELALLHAVNQAGPQNQAALFTIRLLRHLGANPAVALERAFERGDANLILTVFRPPIINGLVSRLVPAADVSNAALRIAITRQDIASIHWSLSENADIHHRPQADQPISQQNSSPLLFAIRGGHYLAAHYLIQRGAKLTDIQAEWLPAVAPNEDDTLRLLRIAHQQATQQLANEDAAAEPPASRATVGWNGKTARRVGEAVFWAAALFVLGLSVAALSIFSLGLPAFVALLLPALPYLMVAFTVLSSMMLNFTLTDDINSDWEHLFLDLYPEVEYEEALQNAKTLAQHRPRYTADQGPMPARETPNDFVVLPKAPAENEALKLNPAQRNRLLHMVNSALNALMAKGEGSRIKTYPVAPNSELDSDGQRNADIQQLWVLQRYLSDLQSLGEDGRNEAVILATLNNAQFRTAYLAFKGSASIRMPRDDATTILGRLRGTTLHPKTMMDGWFGRQWNNYWRWPGEGESVGWYCVKRFAMFPVMLLALPYRIVTFIDRSWQVLSAGLRKIFKPLKTWFNSPTYASNNEYQPLLENNDGARREVKNGYWLAKKTVKFLYYLIAYAVPLAIVGLLLFTVTTLLNAMFNRNDASNKLIEWLLDKWEGNDSDAAIRQSVRVTGPAIMGGVVAGSGLVLGAIAKNALAVEATSYDDFKPVRDKLFHDQEVRCYHFDAESTVDFGWKNNVLLYLSAATFGLSEVISPKWRPYRVCTGYDERGKPIGENPANLTGKQWLLMAIEYYDLSKREGRRNALLSAIKLSSFIYIITMTILLTAVGAAVIVSPASWALTAALLAFVILAGPLKALLAASVKSVAKWLGWPKPTPADHTLVGFVPGAAPAVQQANVAVVAAAQPAAVPAVPPEPNLVAPQQPLPPLTCAQENRAVVQQPSVNPAAANVSFMHHRTSRVEPKQLEPKPQPADESESEDELAEELGINWYADGEVRFESRSLEVNVL